MLYRETAPNVFTRWAGERINDIAYPRSIETKWSEADLAEIELYKPAPADPIPEGKVVTNRRVKRVDGIVRWVNDLEDAPPAPIPTTITARAARFALNEAGLRDRVEDTVNAADRNTQDYWLYSQTIGRQHPVLLGMQQQLGLSDEQVNALFVRADELDK